MKALQINRYELKKGLCDIEKMIADFIKDDLGAKKVTISCTTRNWQGHTCLYFVGKADGVKLIVNADISPYDLEADPWNYPMFVEYDLI